MVRMKDCRKDQRQRNSREGGRLRRWEDCLNRHLGKVEEEQKVEGKDQQQGEMKENNSNRRTIGKQEDEQSRYIQTSPSKQIYSNLSFKAAR